MMQTVMLAGAVAIILLIFPTLYRMIAGPSVFDRIIGGNMIGTKATILLLFIGVLFENVSMFVDISLAYALLNFIGTLAAAKYFQHRPAGDPPAGGAAEEEARP
jgi:multicomponent Na+:H+ antiporter subunit F